MALNLDAIRQRLNKLQNTSKSSVDLWKPQPGKYQVRLLPYKYNLENPFIELYFHYGINNKTYISPMSFGRPDPFVEFAAKLKKTGSKEDWIAGRKMEPKMRVFAPVLVRGAESDGVQFWAFGKTVYQELLSYMADPDFGDITDMMEGFDITVHVQSPEESGKSFAQTSVRVRPKPTPVSDDMDFMKSLIEKQQDVSELFEEPTYDEMVKILNAWLNPAVDESSDDEEEEPIRKPVSSGKLPFELDTPTPRVQTSAPSAVTTTPATPVVKVAGNSNADFKSAFDSLFSSK